MASPTFSVGGLASGLDTNSIVDQLTKLESRPLDLLKSRQSAFQAQVSVLGDLASRLSALATATKSLSTGGVLGTKATSTNTAFAAAPGSGAVAGSYDIAVTQLATPSKWRSDAFAATDTLKGGTLTLTIAGKPYPVTVADGATPSDLAFAIRQSGAPLSAMLLTDETGSTYLSLTTTNTGYAAAVPPLVPPSRAALDVTFAETGTPAGTKAPGFAQVVGGEAKNATFTIDGLSFTRPSNIVADALPGTTLTLKALSPKVLTVATPETLSIGIDTEATQAKLQTFVDAYNTVARLVQGQLAVTKDTDRASTLAGDSTLRTLQGSMQGFVSAVVPGLATVRSLADLGLKTGRDGTLSIDTPTLSAALARDPGAVNAVFADATSGIAKQVSALVDGYTAPGNGLLTARQDGLGQQIRQMTTQADQMQARIDAYRETLSKQFAAMELIVSSMKNLGSFLTQQDVQNSK